MGQHQEQYHPKNNVININTSILMTLTVCLIPNYNINNIIRLVSAE
jgi:hypothetical protein